MNILEDTIVEVSASNFSLTSFICSSYGKSCQFTSLLAQTYQLIPLLLHCQRKEGGNLLGLIMNSSYGLINSCKLVHCCYENNFGVFARFIHLWTSTFYFCRRMAFNKEVKFCKASWTWRSVELNELCRNSCSTPATFFMVLHIFTLPTPVEGQDD